MELNRGWELAGSPAGLLGGPADVDSLTWRPAQVPGTVAGALGRPEADRDLDAEDWWFRVRFDSPDGGGPHVLELDGLATVAEVYLNGTRILESDSMWTAHAVDVTGSLRGDN